MSTMIMYFVVAMQNSNADDSSPSMSESSLLVDGEIPMFSHIFLTFLNN